MQPEKRIRITIDGKLALTVAQIAARHGLAESSVTSIIARERIEPDGMLDGKKKLYLATRIDEIIKKRPGKGVNLRGHK